MHWTESLAHATVWSLVYVSVLATLLFALLRASAQAASPAWNARQLSRFIGILALAAPIFFALQWGRPLACLCVDCALSPPLLALRKGPAKVPGALFVAICWAGWAALCSARTARASLSLRRALSRSQPASPALQAEFETLCRRFGVRARLRVVSDSITSVPALFGIWNPRVLLPRSCADFPPGELHALLGHELAHLRRKDSGWHLVQRAVAALLCFHPAVRHLSRRLDEQRELACDALCISHGAARVELARGLLRLVERPHSLRCPAATFGDLRLRLRALAAPERVHARPARLARTFQCAALSLFCAAAVFGSFELARAGRGRADLGLPGLVLPFRTFGLQLEGQPRGLLLEGADGRRFVSFDDEPFEPLLETDGLFVTQR